MTKHEKVAEFPGNSHEINTIKQVGIGVFLKKSIKNTEYRARSCAGPPDGSSGNRVGDDYRAGSLWIPVSLL